MNWVRFRRWLYLPLLAALIAVAVALAVSLQGAGPLGILIVAALVVVLATPGLIPRLLLHDLLASRAHHARGAFEPALAAAERFLATLKRSPWIRHAIWAQFGVYTLSVAAMAHNNAGAALIELGRREAAREHLRAARAADRAYPVPVFNLAVIAKLDGDDAESERLAAEAAELGFALGRLDAVLAGIGQTYARLTVVRAA